MMPATRTAPRNLLDKARHAWKMGRLTDATRTLEQLLAREPDNAEAFHLLGVVAIKGARSADAILFMEKAVHLAPHDADIWCDFGTALHGAQELQSAEQAYRQVLQLDPTHRDGLFNLANVLRDRKQLQDALILYSSLLQSHPDHVDGWNNTGLVLQELQRRPEARRCFEQVLKLDTHHVLATINLGSVLKEMGALKDAIATYQRGLAFHPNHSGLLLNLGNALNSMGRTDEAIVQLRKALRYTPEYEAAHSSLIFTLDYDPEADTAAQQEARREWYKRCAKHRNATELEPYTRPDPEKKLRIGYVSPDFRATSAAMCFAPMLHYFDRERYEVFCYDNGTAQDVVTRHIQQSVTVFRQAAGLTDAELSALIRADRIDILVDLCGHLRGNRLAVFGRRPAPLQMTGWGYANGTGMPEIACILADADYLPDAEIKHFAEERADVPSVIPYFPFEPLPELSTPPAPLLGYITFGSFSRLQKVNAATVSLWARIMNALPLARLIVKSSEVVDDDVLARLRDEFACAGVTPERIEVLPRSTWTSHMESFSKIDIQLDPLPHGGGVSLLDGLAMGVPSITLRGATPAGRLGASLLRAIGMERGWVASSEDEYVAMAVACANAPPPDISARQAIRDRLLASAVGDPATYAKAVEAAYRRAWRSQCKVLRARREQWIETAQRALLRGESKTAIPVLERIVNGDAEDTLALELAGTAAYQVRNYLLAEDLLRQAVSRPDATPDASINLGIVLTVLRRYEDGITLLKQVTEQHPRLVEAFYNLGCLYMGQRRYADAVETFHAARAITPKSGKILNNLAISYEELGQVDLAEEWLERARLDDPGYALSFANLGRLRFKVGDRPKALERFERALEMDSTLFWVRFELMALYLQMGLTQRTSSLWSTPFRRMNVNSNKRPEKEDARRVATTLAKMVIKGLQDLKQPRGVIEEEMLKNAGRLVELDHPGKIDVLEELIDFKPDCLMAYMQLGIAHHHDEQCDLAAPAWAKGLRKRDELAQAAGLKDLPHRVLDTSWYMAVGHMQMLDIYLKSTALSNQPERTLWLLRSTTRKIPNAHYLKYWSPWLREAAIDQSGDNFDDTARAIGITREQLPLVTDHFFAVRESPTRELWHMDYACSVQKQWEASGRPNLISLDAADRQFGEDVLRNLNIPSGSWYVCFHVREPGFWQNWDKLHPSIRNADITTYYAAMRRVVELGGHVIRMGDKSMRPLPSMAGVIDYAHSEHKSERMDIFLVGSCRLFVGVNSGITLLPPTFGVPCLLTNFVPISIPFPYGRDRMLPKLFRNKRDGRFMTFDEMFKHKVAHSQFAKNVPTWMEVVDNSPEDIVEALDEMLGAEDSCTDTQPKVQALRRAYDDILVTHGGFSGSPMANSFLVRHAHLLGDR